MIVFEWPSAWLLVLPWAGFCLGLGWTQWVALAEARRRVARRFLARVTRYTGRSLAVHLLALTALGAVLIAIVARPVPADPPAGGAAAGGRVLLVFDASASMYATDVEPLDPGESGGGGEISRFEVARAVGRRLVAELDGTHFGVVSFSGTTTLVLPLTGDRELVDRALAALQPHNFYQNTGSSLAGALESVFHFAGDAPGGLQVVLLGDGELPFDESYAEALTGLVDLGLPVHAVAIGSAEGQGRVIWDLRDRIAGKEEMRKLREFTTRRVDRHYREIAAATGGRFMVAEPPAVDDLVADLGARAAIAAEPAGPAADRRAWLPALALAGCLGHLLFLTPWRRLPGFAFDLERLGAPPPVHRPPPAATAKVPPAALWLAAAMVFWACADGPRERAHRANEAALALDELGRHEAARRRFEHSASVGYRPEIPIHNLARSLAGRRRFTEAHQLFQRALELDPGLVDAAFNDGVTLYEWGRAERDPRDCQLARTLELWRAARSRFAAVGEGVVERDEPSARAAQNRQRLDREIAALERLIAEPPDHCAAAGGGGDGEDDGDGGDGGDGGDEGAAGEGGDDGENPAGRGGGGAGRAGAPPPSRPDPPPASGPLSDEERQRIASELDRIGRQALADGRYYRRTREEQFSREQWSRPEAVLWW